MTTKCMNCAVYEYQSHEMPDQIKNVGSEKYKNKVLTMLCNTCHSYRNWTPLNQDLNERFLKSLELRLKLIKCDHLNNQARCKDVDFHMGSGCLYEIDRYCSLRSMEGIKI